jgi:surfeit locus 1 family protein
MHERFRFTLVPTLFTVPALIVLIGLGTWQVQRLAWKTGLIAEREAALTAPAAEAPTTVAAARALDFHHVETRGTFDHSKELYIAALDSRGVAGWQIVTPLTRPDGKILLVNRGFVPDSLKAPSSRVAGEIEGEVPVDGVLRTTQKPTGWVADFLNGIGLGPTNAPAQNFWIYVDIPAMAEAAGLDERAVLPYYIEAGTTPNPGGFPIGGQTRISLPNDHLQYAVTWYLFAVFLVVIYFVYHYKKPA